MDVLILVNIVMPHLLKDLQIILNSGGTFVDIKCWDPIKHPKKYTGKKIFISSVTDQYMPLEKSVRE